MKYYVTNGFVVVQQCSSKSEFSVELSWCFTIKKNSRNRER